MSDRPDRWLKPARRSLLRTLGVAGLVTTVGTDTVSAQGEEQVDWIFKTENNIQTSPTVINGAIFAGNWSGKVFKVEKNTGNEDWSFQTNGSVRAAPTVRDGRVCVGSSDNNMYCLDTSSGDELWKFSTGKPLNREGINSSPMITDELVIFGNRFTGDQDVGIYALDKQSGQERWTIKTSESVTASPTVANKTIFIGGQDGILYALDTDSGSQKWNFETNRAIFSSATVANGSVYVGSDDNNLYAVDAETGDEKWRFSTSGPIKSSPTVVEGTVFIGSYDRNLYAVDAETGAKRWSFTTSGFVHSSPTVASETVFVGSQDGNLYSVDIDDGTKKSKIETGGSIKSSPTVVDGIVFIGSDDGNLYAVKADVAGSSVGSRVDLGTLGHHGATFSAERNNPRNGESENNESAEETTPVNVSPQPVTFGHNIAGTTDTVSLTLSNPSAESKRVERLDTPSTITTVQNCTLDLGFIQFGCGTTIPFDIPSNKQKSIKLRFTAPFNGIIMTHDNMATFHTESESIDMPVTATTLADARTVRSFEQTARECATFIGTGSRERRIAVGDDVVAMYEDVMKFTANRIGRKYRKALKNAKSAGEKLQNASEDLNTKEFITEWEASFNPPEASPQPGQLQENFNELAETLSECRSDIEANELEEAAEHAHTASNQVTAVASDLETAYQEMRERKSTQADAAKHLGDFVAAVQAYETTISGTNDLT